MLSLKATRSRWSWGARATFHPSERMAAAVIYSPKLPVVVAASKDTLLLLFLHH